MPANSNSTVSIDQAARSAGFDVEETYWGYVIRSTDGPGWLMTFMQVASMFLGAALLAAAIGLLVAPQALAGAVEFGFRAFAAVLMVGISAYLLWFASRGSMSEWQIDCTQGEVREVVRNKAGSTTMMGRHGFDAIGGVFLDRQTGAQDIASLMLQFGNTAQAVPLANGPLQHLETLRDRLGQDLLLEQASMAPLTTQRRRTDTHQDVAAA